MKSLFYKTIAFIFKITPFFILNVYSWILGNLAYFLWKRRRETALANLKMIYSDIDEKELKILCKKNFIEIAKTFFEIFKQPVFSECISKNIKVIGEENLKKAYNKGKGVILFTAHFGNWEFAGSKVAELGYKINAVQKNQKNPHFDNILNSYRENNGIGIVGRKTALKQGVKVLKNGEVLVIVGDQKAFRGGIIVDFMGKPASTTPLPAKLCRKYGSPIVGMFLKRVGYVKYELEFTKMYLPDKNSENEEIMVYLNKITEEKINRNPEQWFWGHRRWKIE